MRQLSGTDNLFLRLEHGNEYMHVAGLAIYDPSSAPGGKVRFKDILRFFQARIDALPMFRRRLVGVPLGLDRPYWVEEPLDVEFHVRHIALPQPGDWRQLCIQVARIHSRPLDRSKPLWEAYVIEGLNNIAGLPPGSFALYLKLHHATVDGEAGTEMLKAIHSLTPDDCSEPEGVVRYRDRVPAAIELYARALSNNVARVPRAARLSADTATRLAVAGAAAAGSLKDAALRAMEGARLAQLADSLRKPPQTRFAGKVSAHRVVEVTGLPLASFKRIRERVPDATINDLFLTTVGGALRHYLEAKGELPEQTLTAQVPMSFRAPGQSFDAGNQIGLGVVPLHTELHDPLDRVQEIRRGAAKAKAMAGLLGRDLSARLFDVLPESVSEAVTRRVVLPTMSVVVSNVRGPDVPLYMAGARLVHFAPVSIVLDGLGLNVTGFSYHGTMWVCTVSCRDMMPDPAFFSACVQRSFAALERAAVDLDAAHQTAPRLAAPHKTTPTQRRSSHEVRSRPPDGARAGAPKARARRPQRA
jgi:WS/DGAT/MGAT family acyltransferase